MIPEVQADELAHLVEVVGLELQALRIPRAPLACTSRRAASDEIAQPPVNAVTNLRQVISPRFLIPVCAPASVYPATGFRCPQGQVAAVPRLVNLSSAQRRLVDSGTLCPRENES